MVLAQSHRMQHHMIPDEDRYPKPDDLSTIEAW
jgi:hypothetical protein